MMSSYPARVVSSSDRWRFRASGKCKQPVDVEAMTIYPRRLAERFSPESMRRQFVLARSRARIPPSWEIDRVGDWSLGTNDLPTVHLTDGDERPAGWIIGHAIDPDHGLIREPVQVGPALDRLHDLAGRFVVVAARGSRPRIWLDAGGMLPLVYDPLQEVVASSPMLIPYTEETPDDDDLIHLKGIPVREGFFPFGLTPRKGISRLLPNFCLDLSSWTERRHWPDEIPERCDPGAAVDEIVHIVQRTIRALTEPGSIEAPLTAGYDSRCLLACARGVLDRVRFHTADFPRPDSHAATDIDIASRLARRFGLDHRVVPHVRPTAEELERALYESGCSVGETRGWHNVATMNSLDPSAALITGHAGAVAKAEYHREVEATGPTILERFRLPEHPRLLGRAERWLDTVPDRSLIMDLAHIEQRLACWAGARSVWDAAEALISPLCSRRVFAAAMGLPVRFRKDRLVFTGILQRTWPELLDLPFNQPLAARLRVWKAFRRRRDLARRRMKRRMARYGIWNGRLREPPPLNPL